MKVIHVAESFASGVYDFISDLTKGMPDFNYVIVHGIRPDTPEDFSKDFPPQTQFIPWSHATREVSAKEDLHALFSLHTILKKHPDADIIHLHSSKAGFLGRLASRILGMHRKVIYTPHGASFLRKDISASKRKVFVTLEKVGAFLGGEVVACSKSEMEEFEKEGIPASFINNGVSCKATSANRETPKTVCIGTIGRVTVQKNPEAFNTIAERFSHDPSIRFLWIGDGELAKKLTAPNIEKTGWLRRDRITEKLDEIDIYLSTSLWEGLPLSVLEAMCHAKPLVLSDCVGNRDLVKNGENGYLFRTQEEAFKALAKLIGNPALRAEFAKHSQKKLLAEFSLTKMVEAYLSLYHSLEKRF